MEEINNFDKLKAVVEDMTKHKSELGIEGVFASTSIILIVAILAVSYIVNRKNIINLCESYLYDTCISASDTLYESFYGDSERNDMSVRLEYILNNVGIDTMESSRGYLVDTDGTYLYHENSELVGAKMTDNPVIEEVLTTLRDEGHITTADVRTCTINGKKVYIAFMCTVNDWVIFVQADASDVMAPVTAINTICIIVGLILLFVALVIGYIMTTIISKPITNLTAVINDISELNMSSSHEFPKSKDEIGKMGHAVQHMQEQLSGIVSELNDIAGILVNDSDTLYTISENVNQASTDNAATNEELAASMEETSASTETVNERIKNMNANTATVADKIQSGTVLTNEVMDKTNAIHEKTKSASDETIRVYDSIRKTSSEATKTIEEFMSLANNEVSELKLGIMDITTAMEGISSNISECSVGINDIAEKTTNVVELTVETYERTTNCRDSAQKLRAITSRFKL